VIEILGPPDRSDRWDNLDQNSYNLNPLEFNEDSAIVSYSIAPTDSVEEAKVVEMNPAGERSLKFDYFRTYNLDALTRHFAYIAKVASFYGVVVLAIVSILPIWSAVDCRSLGLYIPVAALVLCVA